MRAGERMAVAFALNGVYSMDVGRLELQVIFIDAGGVAADDGGSVPGFPERRAAEHKTLSRGGAAR